MSETKTNADYNFEELAEKWKESQKAAATCPSCGYCNHCGRGGYSHWYRPYPYYPYITWTTGTGGWVPQTTTYSGEWQQSIQAGSTSVKNGQFSLTSDKETT